MTAVRFNLTEEYGIEQGAEYRFSFQVFEVLPEEIDTSEGMISTEGQLLDLEGLSFRAQLRAGSVNGPVEADVTPERFKREMRQGPSGRLEEWVVMHLPNAMTNAMTATAGVYDIEITDDATGEVLRLFQGTWTLSLNVTRPEEAA